ncbi:MAG TPA: GNAT family N-acetyltransferase [Acidimicrobiales bacterium]|nr:GNAT family N-acetyltransferase [Acidimicrobiales bacterium]
MAELRVEHVEAPTLHELRRRVLRGNDPTKSAGDASDDEATTLHLGGFVGDRLVVSASFYLTTAPINEELVSYQLRFMATDADVQGKGYGSRVLEVAFDELREKGAAQVWAHARDSALGFYVSTGWRVVEGSEHLSTVTHLPHTTIVKSLVEGS